MSQPEASEGFRAYLDGLRRQARRVRLMQALAIILFLAVWEIAPKMQWVNPMLTSNPSAVVEIFFTMALHGLDALTVRKPLRFGHGPVGLAAPFLRKALAPVLVQHPFCNFPEH